MRLSTEIGVEYKKSGAEKAFEFIRTVGYECVDYNMPFYSGDSPNPSIYETNRNYFEKFFEDERKYAENAGISIYQTHAPYHTYHKDPALFACRIEEIKYSIIATAILGAEYTVMHCAQPCGFLPDRQPEVTKQINYELLSKLLPVAQEYGVKIALENMPGDGVPTATPDSLIEYIDMMNSEYLVACLDTGHANLTGGAKTSIGENIVGFAKKLGKRLKVLHINDNCGRLDEHYPPFLGTIPNWKEFMQTLKDIGYEGTLNTEAGSFVRKMPLDLQEDARRLSYGMLKALSEL